MSLEELKDVLKDELEKRGVLNKVRARLRAEVFHSLEENDQIQESPPLNETNLIINELVRDYLEWNRYNHANSVFIKESGQPSESLQRKFLASELNVGSIYHEKPDIPLLYGIIEMLRSSKSEKIKKKPGKSSSKKKSSKKQQEQQPEKPYRSEKPNRMIPTLDQSETDSEYSKYSSSDGYN
eukprot:gb/GECH01007402.1/.p1 GENE.gb/GECH01007402.1/~~gb/GECH01007402.1/.p1  ORF type:complete len:182 (+),score=59.24 gb/GECH01007402.1/:1-546(+)